MIKAFGLLTLIILTGSIALGAETMTEDKDAFRYQHQLGIRLGGWNNLGETPPDFFYNSDSTARFKSKVGDVDFFFEGYYAYRLIPQALVEFSVGIVNRGTISILEGNRSDVGNLLVYPILMQFKLYPLSLFQSRIQPYVTLGGGLYYGRLSVQFTNDYFSARFSERSETDFNYALSGGIDYLLSSTIGLDFNFKYYPINFSRGLANIRNYDGMSITVGVKYLYKPKKTFQRGRTR